MAYHRLTRHTSVLTPQKLRQSRMRQPCFTMKRPLVFQVRKSLVEYVDDELLKMNTSVFYQRIFILAKNLDPNRESVIAAQLAAAQPSQKRASLENAADDLRTADAMVDEDQHYSQQTTEDSLHGKDTNLNENEPEEQPKLNIVEPEVEKETVTNLFRFDNWDDEAPAEAEMEEAEAEPDPDMPDRPKDMYTLFSEMLQDLQKKCRYLSYTPDPMCGLFLYMNEYTMLMLESGEDMMGIFCEELLQRTDEFWQSNRVFMIEDHIKELYTKELLNRRIPAAFLNEKFPTSTPTDEYLMGKQHLIIKDKLNNLCSLISDSLEPHRLTEISERHSTLQTDASEQDLDAEGSDDDPPSHHASRTMYSQSQMKRRASAISDSLAPETFRKLLPEIQRIELVLASTRFYYTLDEFFALYGNVPFSKDDDGLFWPIQNNYAPPNIFRRTPFDINLTFADYAAEMNRRLQEEQDKHKAEIEAAEAAEAYAAEQAMAQTTKTHQAKEQDQDAE